VKRIVVSLTGVVVCSLLAAPGNGDSSQNDPPGQGKKIKVLILDGYSNHDWRLTTALIRGIIEPTGLFDVAVATAPPTAKADGWDQWRPKFKDYDVVIQTCNDLGGGPSWPPEVQRDFEAFVKDGGGVYVFHGGNNAFPKWNEYDQIIGLGWRNKSAGVALTIDAKGNLVTIPAGEGQSTGHGPRVETVLHRVGDHPIHKDFPRHWRTTELEVYFYARGPAQNLEVLSYTYDPRTKMDWPIEWVVSYGKGKVYNSTFGHVWKGDVDPVSMRCAGVQTVLTRALQWLSGQPVTYPVPADFPTEGKLSIRPPVKLPAP
jgi:type 1 glutamine amidotransferase